MGHLLVFQTCQSLEGAPNIWPTTYKIMKMAHLSKVRNKNYHKLIPNAGWIGSHETRIEVHKHARKKTYKKNIYLYILISVHLLTEMIL